MEKRISVLDEGAPSLTKIARETDLFMDCLQSMVAKARCENDWRPWDFNNELTAKPHLERGYIDAREDVLLRRHIDVIELFGVALGGHQSGGWTPPERFGLTMVWFPRLYKNDKWDNSLSEDGEQIIERNLDDSGNHILDQSKYGSNHLRAVFARKEEPLIGTLYRFVGVFKYSREISREKSAAVYHKTSNRIKLCKRSC